MSIKHPKIRVVQIWSPKLKILKNDAKTYKIGIYVSPRKIVEEFTIKEMNKKMIDSVNNYKIPIEIIVFVQHKGVISRFSVTPKIKYHAEEVL